MPCVINAGYAIDCNKDSVGGLSKMYIAPKNDIVGYTEDVNGIITAVDMVTGKMFYEFALVKSASSFQTSPVANPTNGTSFYNESLTLILNKMKAATSKLVDSLVKASLVVIVVDRNGEALLLGRTNGLDVSGGNAGSGVATADRNGYELQLTGEEAKISHVDPTIIASLLVPAV